MTISMKKTHFLLQLILIVVITGIISCSNDHRAVLATLTKEDKKGNKVFTEIKVNDSTLIDLKFCLKNYEYPPKLPENIFWLKPDTAKLSSFEKENVIFKYNFDPSGKVRSYYYQGSQISGIFPLLYSIHYDKDKPELITQIYDVFYKTKYQIKYDNLKNVQWIEKLDSLDKRIEILLIKIK
jgi:hypothetical protein